MGLSSQECTKSKKKLGTREYKYIGFEGKYRKGYKGNKMKKSNQVELKNFYEDISYLVMVLPNGDGGD